MNGILPVAIGAVAAAAVIATIKYKRTAQKTQDIEKIYVDEVNMGELKIWFSDKMGEDGAKGLILLPTMKNLKRFNIPIKEADHVLVQAVYNTKKDEISAYREISFSEVGKKLNELLNEGGGVFIVDRWIE